MSADNYPVEEHELRRAADSLHAFNYTSDANTVESALIELLALRAEKQRLLDWQTQATVNCAKRRCATRERNMADCEAEVASWKRLADIQEQSLKESCAEVEWLQATLAKALTWVPRSGIPGRFKAEVEKQLAVTVSAQRSGE